MCRTCDLNLRIIKNKNILLQAPDCSEINVKEIVRVNCQTGKKLK